MIVPLLAALLSSQLCAQPSSTTTLSARPLTLDEAYQLTLQRSELIAIQGEGLAEAEARVSELYGNVQPRLSLVGTQIWQDEPPNAGAFGNNFAQKSRPQAQINARQPLFSGFRDFLALRAAKLTTQAAELDLLRAKQRLYEDVTRAYLDLLGLQQELAARRVVVEQTSDRTEELRRREKIGRSRGSEILAADAQLAQAVADLETAKGAERAAQWALRFLTGLDEDLTPSDVALPQAPEFAGYLERSRRRPDVEARRKDADAAKHSIGVWSRQRWPLIALDGNYYLKRPTGFTENIKWDVTLSGTLPLYWGGQISAQTRGAEARERAAKQNLTLALRTAELEAQTRHEALVSGLSRVAALEKAARAASANAQAQAADYRLGLVTNLDVLTALNQEQVARLAYTRARLDAYLSLARLETAAGGPR